MKSLHNRKLILQELVAMVGGMLILAGMILFGMSALAISGYLEMGIILESKYLLVFAIAAVTIGLLDIFAAVIIARW